MTPTHRVMLTAEDSVWQARFPSLFNSQSLDFAGVGYRHLSMAFTLETPPDDLVGNVRVIGHSQGRLVVCSNDGLALPPWRHTRAW